MRTHQAGDGRLFCLAELRKLFGDVLHRAVMLAELDGAVRGVLHARREAIDRKHGSKLPCAFRWRASGQRFGVSTFRGCNPLLRVLGDEVGLRLPGHEAESPQRNVVIDLLECIASSGSDRVDLGRTATATRSVGTGSERSFFVRRDVLGTFERIEMPTNGGGRDLEFGRDLRGARRAGLEKPSCHTGSRSVYFHNPIVT